MFVEHKEAGEEIQAPAKVLKLSEAIRIGCPWVQETHLYSGCAIGTGYRVLTGRNLEEDINRDRSFPLSGKPYRLVGNAFGIPADIVHEASELHYRQHATREECADWLEKKGY